MRRSAAPSMRKAKQNENKSITSIRSTETVLEIFKNTKNSNTVNEESNENSKSTNVLKSENESVSEPLIVTELPNERVYNIVWGKKSARKHKKWEGDGTLIVKNRSAILKDENGQDSGRLTNISTETLIEGHIFSIGGKEVQIIDLVSQKTVQKPQEKPITQPKKKPRLSASKPSTENGFVLPQPPLEHQWKNNSGKPITDVYVDDFLSRKLRPHQKQGIAFLYECVMGYKITGNNGAILADEMGLGKTLQCISLIWTMSKQGPYGGNAIVNKTLVVVPSGLLKNWIAELDRWIGHYRMYYYMVDAKHTIAKYTKECPKGRPSIMLISYDMFVRNATEVCEIGFDFLICDEGHRLKNDSTKLTKLLDATDIKHRILVTGTPVQNDLLEFYTLSNFVNKGILGDPNEFKAYYVQPITSSRNSSDDDVKQFGKKRENDLNRKIGSFVLRRRANELNGILPTKTELVVFVPPSKQQIDCYIKTVDSWRNVDPDNRPPHLSVLAQMQRICAHPHLTKENDVSRLDVTKSTKLSILIKLLEKIYSFKERIVIVSSRTRILDLIEHLCKQFNYKTTRLDGSTLPSVRQSLVNRFNDGRDGVFVFLLSSRAGGVGLNLVGASRVVLFDSDWNPATDLQAMARIWRDGQRKSVYIYRLLTAGTIEEKIFQRQITKTDLSNAVVDPDKKGTFRLSDEEVKDLLNTDQIEDVTCATHTALGCVCVSDGTIPKRDENVPKERKCQLGASGMLKNDKTTFMNQLMRWEHHAPPFNEVFLSECGLKDCCEDMTFVFGNVCRL